MLLDELTFSGIDLFYVLFNLDIIAVPGIIGSHHPGAYCNRSSRIVRNLKFGGKVCFPSRLSTCCFAELRSIVVKPFL